MNKYDAIIVLGRGISAAGELPESAKATIRRAVELYEEGYSEHVIFSGKWSRSFNFTPPTTEASAMSEYSKTLKLPAAAVLLEEESLDTISNCYNIKTQILAHHPWRNFVLITLHPMDKRAAFIMGYVFGPEFSFDVISIDFDFPTERLDELKVTESEKLKKLQRFLSNVTPGDHEIIMAMHLEYIRTYQINH